MASTTRPPSTASLAAMVPELRQQFPALARRHGDQPVIYLDGPAGSQVPQNVIDAISDYYAKLFARAG